jgi:thiol-disulfide isomerase/thioredoxin
MPQTRSSPGRWPAALALLALSISWDRTAFGQPPRGVKAPAMKSGAAPTRVGPGAPADPEAARAAKWLQEAFEAQPTTEAAEMLIAILKGSQMGMGDGWFHAGQTRYDWRWLAKRHHIKETEAIAKDKFLGSAADFARLDRNKDGELRADDFDWSDRSPGAQQAWQINRLFRQINQAGDGRLSREEWLKFFDRGAQGKEHMTAENLREALAVIQSARMLPGDMPTPKVLVRGLFRGEIGSMHEGPKLDDPAPDFSLKTRDGKQTLRLSDHFGDKPIVLMFGNFTCGPFRSIYPMVDELAQRYKDKARFLGIYVREAHPTDGWRMGSNDDVGVSLRQPRDYLERSTAANQCSAKLKMSIPLLVDEMDDRVGHAYSGMPARLYVIDRSGRIAYKSGRGPFGFKPGEMEQALLMALLDQQKPDRVSPISAGGAR